MVFTTGNDSTGTIQTNLMGGVDPDGKVRAIAVNDDGSIKTGGDANAGGGGFSSTIWTDDGGAYYVRRETVTDGVVTVTYVTPTGTPATPGTGLRPLASTDRDLSVVYYEVIASGTGYSTGDLLARIIIVDSNANAVTGLVWFNISTGLTLASAPNNAQLERADEVVSTKQSGTWSVGVSNLSDIGDRLGANSDTPVSTPTTLGSLAAVVRGFWQSLLSKLPSALVGDRFKVDVSFPTTQQISGGVSVSNLGSEITGTTIPSGGSGLIGWLSALWQLASDRLPALVSGRIPVSTDPGSAITGENLESGGIGSLGWLSSIRKLIGDRLPPTLGAKTSANSLSFTPATDATFALGASTNFVGRQGIRGFRATISLIRPADTIAYTMNDAISNSTSSPTTYSADLSSFGAIANGFICITNARIISDVAQSTLPTVNLFIFNQAFTATNDNSQLSIIDSIAQSGGVSIPCSNTYNLGANSRCTSDPGQWIMQLNASSTNIFFALQATNTYTPASGERFDVIVEGYLL